MMALPEDTFEHRRMKAIFRNNCAGCHQPNFVLQNKFDADGWRNIINVMERVGIYGDPPRLDQAPFPLIRAFKDELVKYLTEMRGPGPSPMKFKLLPRHRGASAVLPALNASSAARACSAHCRSLASRWASLG